MSPRRASSTLSSTSTRVRFPLLVTILYLMIWSDPDGDDITMEGTMKLCEDLEVNPDEDCVLYAIAYELKSPRMGEWTRKGWTDGWKILGYVFILFHTKITVKLNVSKAWIPCRRWKRLSESYEVNLVRIRRISRKCITTPSILRSVLVKEVFVCEP